MKKLIVMLSILTVVLAISGCGATETDVAEESKTSETTKVEDKVAASDTTKEEAVTDDEAIFGEKPDNYPTETINIIVPAAAGTLIDLVSRDVANMLDLDQDVIITNRGGAGQTIGSAEVALAKGDGYTIGILGDTGLLIKPTQMGLSYSVDDFRYLGLTASQVTNMLVASPESPYKTWEEVVEAAKAGEDITYTTGNAGSMSHLAMINLMSASGIQLKFIPFNGSGEVNAALTGGHVDLGMLVLEPNLKRAIEGQVVPLVNFTEERLEEFPDVTTSLELGVSAEDYKFMVVMCLPKETPDEIYNYLKVKVDEVFNSAEYKASRQKMGSDAPTIFTEEELTSKIIAEQELITRLSKEAGLIQ